MAFTWKIGSILKQTPLKLFFWVSLVIRPTPRTPSSRKDPEQVSWSWPTWLSSGCPWSSSADAERIQGSSVPWNPDQNKLRVSNSRRRCDILLSSERADPSADQPRTKSPERKAQNEKPRTKSPERKAQNEKPRTKEPKSMTFSVSLTSVSGVRCLLLGGQLP